MFNQSEKSKKERFEYQFADLDKDLGNLTWSHIAKLLDVGAIYHNSDGEREHCFTFMKARIKELGFWEFYQKRYELRFEWEAIEKPKFLSSLG